MAYIDLETWGTRSVMDLGASAYSKQPDAEILMMAYSFESDPLDIKSIKQWMLGDPFPSDLLYHIKHGGLMSAWNVWFEKCFWYNVGRPKYGFPTVHPDNWRDSMAKGLSHSLPMSLDGACSALRISEEHHKQSGKKLIQMFSCPQKDGSRILPEHRPAEWINYRTYNKYDVLAERAIDEQLPDLKPHELKRWKLNQKINERGVPIDVVSSKAIYPKVTLAQGNLANEISDLTNQRILRPTMTKRIVTYMNENGVALPNCQADTITDALKGMYGTPNETCRKILEIRTHAGKSSVGKFKRFIDMADENNLIKGTLVFRGTITGRDISKDINMLNLAKPTVEYTSTDDLVSDAVNMSIDEASEKYGSYMKLASSVIRMMVAAPEGKKLVQSDFSSIEARLVFWFADCNKGLQMYRDKIDAYIKMATTIYTKAYDDVTDGERFAGKQAILGCGFGLAWKGFQNTCLQYGVELPDELCKTVIDAYRGDFPEVVKLWNHVENAAMSAVRSPGSAFQIPNGKIKFMVKGKFLYMLLPSGSMMAYPFPKIEVVKTPWGSRKEAITYRCQSNGQWMRTSTYGGKLTENFIQSSCRDLLENAKQNCEDISIPVLFTVYDELIVEMEDDDLDIPKFEAALIDLPSWLTNFPMDVESKILTRYTKV